MSGVHVCLRVGGESYALAVEHVLEVGELGEVAQVPGAPASALGVKNVRGQVLPVFDLATLFGIERGSKAACLVVAEEAGRRVGFAVDEVTDVRPLSAPTEESDSRFLVGATLEDGQLVGVVDVAVLVATLERVTS